jgi:DNA-binding CsgD family transcriptional regulator
MGCKMSTLTRSGPTQTGFVAQLLEEIDSGPNPAQVLALNAAEPIQTQLSARIALSRRETQAMVKVAQGFSTKEIADQLSISRRTVDAYRTGARRKLKLHGAAEVTRYVLRSGLRAVFCC